MKRGRFGNRPLADEHLFKAIERFQDDQGLEVDGLMKPGGPTVTRLNAVLGRHARNNGAVAAPIAAPAPAPDDGDGPRFVDLFRARREAGAPEGFGPAFTIFEHDAPAPQLAQAQARNRQTSGQQRRGPTFDERIENDVLDARRYREPPSRQGRRFPPPPRDGREWTPFRSSEQDRYPQQAYDGEAPFWDAMMRNPAVGPRLREALEFTLYAEGGTRPDRNRQTGKLNAAGGVTPNTMERVRRSNQFDPALLEGVPPGRVDVLLPDQRLAIHLHIIDETLRPAGQSRGMNGLQVIEDIGNRPRQGAREVSMAVADSIVRLGGPRARQAIQAAVNRLADQLGDRAPQELTRLPANADRFGPATLSAITVLIDAGHADALRSAILDQYALRATDPGDRARIRALRELRLRPMRPDAQ